MSPAYKNKAPPPCPPPPPPVPPTGKILAAQLEICEIAKSNHIQSVESE